MRQNFSVFALVSVLAALAFWLSTRAGISSEQAINPLAALSQNTSLFCSIIPQEALSGAGSAGAWGMLVLVPLPFLLVGLLGYSLYRSSRKNLWKDGLNEWDY